MPSSPSVNIYTQGGGTASSAQFPSSPVQSTRAPASSDIQGAFGQYPIGQQWVNTSSGAVYSLASFSASGGTVSASWTLLGGAASDVNSLAGDSGSATPTSGIITIAGTANQISTVGSGSSITISLPAAVTAPGSLMTTTSLSSTTTVTGGTGVTATLGNITATNGNLVVGTAGNKLSIATGANASIGTATLTNGTVTVSTTAVTASSIILLTRMSVGTTGANDLGILSVGTVVAGTSFVINSWTVTNATALQTDDQSVVSYIIIN